MTLIDIDGGVAGVVGGEHFHAGDATWSPDGGTIAFSGGPDDNPAIGLYDVASGAVTWAWRQPLDAHHPAWSPDGRELAFLVDRDGDTGLCHLDLRTNQVKELSLGPGTHAAPCFTAVGDSLLVVHSSFDHPPELYEVELRHGAATHLTSSLPPDLADQEFVDAVQNPVAITVIFTASFIFSSMTAPKIILASSCAALWMMVQACCTSASFSEAGPGDVDQDAAGAVDCAGFKQRRSNGLMCGFRRCDSLRSRWRFP